MAARDRLHSMDLVPDHAQDDIVWAVRELNKRARTQAEILFDLNIRLVDKGVDPISPSAFSRKAVRLKALRQRMDTAREVLAGVGDLTAGDVDNQAMELAHVIMMLIAELVADGEDRSSKQVKEIADAFKSIVTGQKLSADRRRKLEADAATAAEKREREKTAAAVDRVAKEAGVSKETINLLKREFAGVRPTPPEAPVSQIVP